LSLGLRKLGILTVLAVVSVALGLWRQGGPAPEVEASLATPGGISALPTAGPGIPGMADQALPAIIRARPPGNNAVVTVFCDPFGKAPAPWGLATGFPLQCPVKDAAPTGRTSPSGSITFEITRLYPLTGSPAATFHASGTDTLVCKDNAACDLSATPKIGDFGFLNVGIVAVQVDGGGTNEIIEVHATDERGESRSVQIAIVDTIMAFGTTGPVSTASQVEPLVVSYACDDVGRAPATQEMEIVYPRRVAGKDSAADADSDGIVGLDDLWDLLYGWGSTFGLGLLDNAPLKLNETYPPQYQGDVDIPLYWCGGDTASPLDDAVTFETDRGIFSIDPAAQEIPGLSAEAAANVTLIPAFMDVDCDEGKSIDVTDVDSLTVWARALPTPLAQGGPPPPQEGGCDLDFARNGVVSYLLLGNGEVGTVMVKAQQGGGVSPPRTINAVFIGEPRISLFLTAPSVVGPEGGEFTVAIVDPGFRPVADATVQCTVDPPGGALMVVPQTGTTEAFTGENPGQVIMRLVPTGNAVEDGETLTLSCVVDRDRSVRGVAIMTLSSTPVTEALDLVPGCNPAVSTWPNETVIATVAGAVAPAEALDGIWALNPDGTAWLGYSPTAPEGVNDLVSLNQLDAFMICVNAPATVTRPVI
jgi:hypothetical protein